MEDKTTFKTKTGYCHILPDKIVLTRDGIIGNVSKVTVGDNVSRILIIYSLFTVGILYLAYDAYVNGETVEPFLLGLVAVYLVYGVVTSINNSATPIIDRQKIKSVKFRKGIPGLTRSRFEILFEDDYKKVKKRLIFLPGSLSNGQSETKKAIEVMTNEKLIQL
ncbi:hypothetical protein [Mucilaginibacter puniceus]